MFLLTLLLSICISITRIMCLFSFRFPRFLFVMLFLQFDSLSSSNSSSSAMLCRLEQSSALLLFKQSFSIYTSASTVLWSLDDSYPKTESWKQGKDCCLWDGVTCDTETGYVVGLNLSYGMLYGSIRSDSSLFSLSHLRYLDLSHNHFKYSPISSRFGDLFNLVHLNLNSARFSGSIPSQISQLSRLVSLDLSGNDVMTVETDTFDRLVHNLTNLRELNFNGVDMSMVAGLPKSLMNLTSSLSTLKLGSCRLSGPEFLDYLPNSLISLDLSDNDLKLDTTSFHTSFQNLSSLRELEMNYVNLSLVSLTSLPSSLSALTLSSCGLGGQFPDIFHLSELVSLDLSENDELTIDTAAFRKIATNLSYLEQVDMSQVNMSLVQPVYFLNLPSSLSRLYLNYCGLRGEFPTMLLQRPTLKKLALRGNEDLNGSLPDSNWSSSLRLLDLSTTKIPILLQPGFFNNLKSLKRLYLFGCNFVGSNLELFGNLRQLTLLDISFNNFSGEIPSSFQNLKLLQVFSIRNNNFSGPIPNYFENFTQLIYLSVTYNKLTGSINSVARALSNLVYLNLSVNFLHGTIPSSLFTLPFLEYLFLNDNGLDGCINHTTPISSISLYQIDLSNNKLSCQIPTFRSKSLSFMKFSNNMLNGTVPSSLCIDLPNLEQLLLYNNQLEGFSTSKIESNSIVSIDLSNNKLSGQIPSFQSNSLLYINLRDNILNGPIPDSAFNVVNLMALMLQSNKILNGELPSSLCKLHFLEILDLSNNSFHGFIPPCLGNFSNSLSVLNLEMNDFEGTVPDKFSDKCGLKYLNLGGNQLQGKIPKSIINCEDLELIDLSNNKMNDTFPDFLAMLPRLQVLLIRSNKFHGSLEMMIKSTNSNLTRISFPTLRLFDLSNNTFSGPLPAKYFDHFEAMMSFDNGSYMGSSQNYSYGYSVNLVLKGVEIKLEKIITLLTSIDLSSNHFTGKIPAESIGKLKSLKLLNLSHNSLTGNIEASLANLTNLESLDLSSNLLSGRLPGQLVDLTFLQVFRVSFNRLEGPIPQGKQFNTFDNSSYEGNSRLCGFPLSAKCEIPNDDPSGKAGDNSEMEDDGFGWKSIVTGYGCGAVFGVGMGYLVFTTRKPARFINMVEAHQCNLNKRRRIKKRKT